MEINFFDYNILKNNPLLQNPNSDFSFPSDDFTQDNIKDNIFPKQLVQYQTPKEQNIKDFGYCNEQINLINLTEHNDNRNSSTTCENNLFLNNNKLNSPFKNNIEKSNYKKEKIFKVLKINKKIGRMKKNSITKGKHNNLSEDNLIRKIKRRFLEKLRLYINYEYQIYLLQKSLKKNKSKNWLRKVNPLIWRQIKVEENLKWFTTKIAEIFSGNLSERYSNSSKDLNRRKIRRVYTLNEAKNLIIILNSDIELYFDKYIKNEKIKGFKTLKDDIKELRIQMENTAQESIEEYLKKYEYIAKNMKDIFLSKKSRNINSINKIEKNG